MGTNNNDKRARVLTAVMVFTCIMCLTLGFTYGKLIGTNLEQMKVNDTLSKNRDTIEQYADDLEKANSTIRDLTFTCQILPKNSVQPHRK